MITDLIFSTYEVEVLKENNGIIESLGYLMIKNNVIVSFTSNNAGYSHDMFDKCIKGNVMISYLDKGVNDNNQKWDFKIDLSPHFWGFVKFKGVNRLAYWEIKYRPYRKLRLFFKKTTWAVIAALIALYLKAWIDGIKYWLLNH